MCGSTRRRGSIRYPWKDTPIGRGAGIRETPGAGSAQGRRRPIACGFYLESSTHNTFGANACHHNQLDGFALFYESSDNGFTANSAHHSGGHGFQTDSSTAAWGASNQATDNVAGAVGMNSIAAYIAFQLFRGWIENAILAFLRAPITAMGTSGEIVLAMLVLAAQWFVLFFFYRNRIFYKV